MIKFFSNLVRKKPEKTKTMVRYNPYEGSSQVARLGDFSIWGNSANADLEHSLESLRNRSRHLYRNSPYFRRWVKQLQTNVVGHKGFQIQVTAKNLDGGMDKSGNEKVKVHWNKWGKIVTADGMMSIAEACKMAIRTWARDGECFAEIAYGSQFPHGMALHFFESDMVDHTLNRARQGSANEIRMGVEIDRYGKPVAYHVLQYHPGDVHWTGQNAKQRRRVPADRIIHLFIKDRPSQVRGEPAVAAAMLTIKMLDGYRDAEVTGRRVASAKGGFFVKERGANGSLSSIADEVEEDTSGLVMEAHPGKMTALPEGWRFEKFDMSEFSTDYKDFESQMIRAIAMALDTSYISISGDLTSVSYSSIRSGEVSDRDVWRGLQAFLVEGFLSKVNSKWYDAAFQFSDIRLPYDRREKWRDATSFRGRGWSWVDPAKEVQASKEAIEAGLTTLTDVVNEQGGDVEEILRKKQSEAEMEADYDVNFTNKDAPDSGNSEG